MIPNKAYCNICKTTKVGASYKVATKFLGSLTIEQAVCAQCHSAYQERMNNEFWRGDTRSEPGKCSRCAGELQSQSCHPVHRYSEKGRTYETMLICSDCYPVYQKCCAEVAVKK